MDKPNGISSEATILSEILAGLKSLQQENTHLAAAVDAINGRVNILAGVKQVQDGKIVDSAVSERNGKREVAPTTTPLLKDDSPTTELPNTPVPDPSRRPSLSSKIILTSYPGQAGVDPLPMDWGNKDPTLRGPVVVSRYPGSIRRRNAIGAHGGSYAIYNALAVASKNLDTDHRPDFTNTEPAADIGPFPQWYDRSHSSHVESYQLTDIGLIQRRLLQWTLWAI